MAEYIEREALIASIESIDWYSVHRGELTAGAKSSENPLYKASEIYSAIDNAPSANVATVRHGRWIEYTKVIIPEPYNKWEQAWKCSECGFDDGFVAYNYCPNCGAKMDGD